jgi:hypothetical protein
MRATIALLMMSMMAFAGCADDSGRAAEPSETAAPTTLLTDATGDVADAFLDAVGGSITETPESLVLEIEVASIPDDLGAMAAAGYSFVDWDVCWTHGAPSNETADAAEATPSNETTRTSEAGPDGVEVCAGTWSMLQGSRVDIKGHLGIYGVDGCNNWEWCEFAVPFEVTPGTPGKVKVTVPKDVLPPVDGDAVIAAPHVSTVGMEYDSPLAPTGFRWAYVYVFAGGIGQGANVPPAGFLRVEDSSAAGDDLVISTSLPAPPPRDDNVVMLDPASDVVLAAGIDDPRLDILSMAIEEDEARLTWAVEVADLAAAPTHGFYGSFGVGEFVLESWYDVAGGVVSAPGGGYCTRSCEGYVDYAIDVAFEAGSPGTVRISVDKASIPTLKGATVNLVDFYLFDDNSVGTYQLPVGTPAFAYAYVNRDGGDWAWGALPYTFA